MSDTVQVEEKPVAQCPGCGVEVREGSEFCFNCGEKLDPVVETTNEDPPRVENGFRAVAPGATQKGRERRRRPTPVSNEPIHVRWQHDDDPGLRFLVLSLVLALIALVLTGIGFYLR